MSPREAALAARLSQAYSGWALRLSPDGYVLMPPGGDEALIRTAAALEDWLRHQERRVCQTTQAEPLIEQMEMELV